MTGLEALMWRLGRRHPSLVPWMGLRVGLDKPVRRADVARRLEEVARMVPRLRDRVAEPPLAGLPPRWEPDPSFDVHRHLRLGPEAEPPGDAHPPWCAALVDGRTLDLLMHHSYTDGLGAMRLLAELFDGPFSAPPPPPAAASGAVEELAVRSLRTLGRL
jgi:diacylglycerol O-acyltransferase